jgi:3-(3-hydroxy-phenyl)propionate hydroxylase
VQDAANLGWKLAQVVRWSSPESLLDSYEAERRPVAARVLRSTMAEVALRRPDDRTRALAGVVAELLALDEPRRLLAAELSGLGVRYPLGDGHPLLGRRMPDLELRTADGPARVFERLHHAGPLLLDFGAAGGFDLAPWSDRVQRVRASCPARWELPEVGALPAPGAVLVRPDGYVAWTGEREAGGLSEALEHWFGPPRV